MPIETIDLSHIYMDDSPFRIAAIEGINLSIGDGEFVGIIGHTGSGKSTLIQHLNGLLKPTSGTVLVDGLDLSLKSTDLRAVRKRVGLVFQYPEYQLFEETVEKDIGFGPRNLGLGEAEIKERVQEAARLTGLKEKHLSRSPFELSGGQKRRCAIAGVLAMRPHALILDEPTAGLDPKGREDMLALMQSLHDEQGSTMVMVSHSMNDVARLCERVFVMNKGTLALSGTPDEIFMRGEELVAMGLGLPEGAQLADALREKGFPIQKGVWRAADLTRALVALLSGKDGGEHAL